MLTNSLPDPLADESFLCQFTSDGASFTVEAVGSGTVYTCNVTARISTEFSRLVSGTYHSTYPSLYMCMYLFEKYNSERWGGGGGGGGGGE